MVISSTPPRRPRLVPPLEPGDRLTRAEFERRYEAMADVKKAELLNGIVHMPSPIRFEGHAEEQARIITWLGIYQSHTPGVRYGGNASVRLDIQNEAQPDAILLIDPRCGGQAQIDEDKYVAGGPELVVEVASSSVSYDLHIKAPIYQQHKVREYLVWRVLDREVDWFLLRRRKYELLPADAAGILQSVTFPGLWLDAKALVRGNARRLLHILQQGLASPEHAAFVTRLQRHQ